MGNLARRSRISFHRAVAASIVLHVVIAVAVVVMVTRPISGPRGLQASLDTRVTDGTVRIAVVEELALTPPAVEAVQPPEHPVPATEPAPPESPALAPRPPLVRAAPDLLPAEAAAIIRRGVVTSSTQTPDPHVQPTSAARVPPMHGALKAGQTIVYVLDCSGSMGEHGMLARARDSLIATLRQQPDTVRFQVIAYSGTAQKLLPGGCVPTTPEHIAEVETHLTRLSATGRSDHAAALRMAVALRPDVIVLLTDAHDFSTQKLKPLLAAAPKPVILCMARVTPQSVGAPQEFR